MNGNKSVDNGPVLNVLVDAPGWGEVVVKQPVDGLTMELLNGMADECDFVAAVAAEAAKQLNLEDEEILLNPSRVFCLSAGISQIASKQPPDMEKALLDVSLSLLKLYHMLKSTGY